MISQWTRKLRRWGAILSMIAVSGTFGGHWLVPQLLAWGQMLVKYSAQSQLVTAVQDTFSGKKPCPVCHRISQGKTEESRSPVYLSLLTFEPYVEPGSSPFEPRLDLTAELALVRIQFAPKREIPPPTPPPRLG